MKKIITFLTSIIGAISLSASINLSYHNVKADSDDGYLICEDGEYVDGFFQIITNTPWEANAKWEISFDTKAIDKQYIVIDYDVTLSRNNPELVSLIYINGNKLEGYDGEMFHGSSREVMKNWGDWFFLPPGRNGLYLPVEKFLSQVEEIDKFGLYFDTGFDDRSGSSINIYGLYLADTYEEELGDNLIEPLSYQEHEEKISSVGVTATIEINKSSGLIKGAYLFGDYLGALNIHVKSPFEKGHIIHSPDDYGYVTINLDQALDISNDEGFAFSIYALDGETFFRLSLEDEEGHFFAPKLYGGPRDDAGSYPFVSESILVNISHFYGAIYLGDKENGTVYIPYSEFAGQDYMFGTEWPIQHSRITNIKKIHIGLDMEYGLGRNLVINEFATCDAYTKEISSIVRLSELSETEWNRNNFEQSTKLILNNSEQHNNNFIFHAIDENEIPGARQAADITELVQIVELAKSLNKNDYTKETWEVLEVKLENAENLITYSELYEQSDIDEAARDLLKAIRGLKPVEVKPKNNVNNIVVIIASIAGGSALLLIAAGIVIFVVIKKKRGSHHE